MNDQEQEQKDEGTDENDVTEQDGSEAAATGNDSLGAEDEQAVDEGVDEAGSEQGLGGFGKKLRKLKLRRRRKKKVRTPSITVLILRPSCTKLCRVTVNKIKYKKALYGQLPHFQKRGSVENYQFIAANYY